VMSGPAVPELPMSLRANPRLSRWLKLGDDGTVRVSPGKVEMGQGIVTALAQIAADELDVDLSRIRMLPVSTAGSPDENYTAGSHSIQHCGMSVRQACAEARAILLEAAAARLARPAAELAVSDGRISAPGSGVLTYWELDRPGLLDQEATGRAAPKPVAARRLIGRQVQRLDLPAKVTGEPVYVADLVLPGMLHARVLRPARPGAVLAELDEEPVRALPGVVEIVRDGSFAAVVAAEEEQAVTAVAKLAAGARWEGGHDLPDEKDLVGFLTNAPVDTVERSAGGPAGAAPVTTVSASYTRPFLAHGSIGPACALAWWHEDVLSVWGATQGVFNHRADLARAFALEPDQIVVQHVEGPGCYGHNGADDAMYEAALLARAIPDRPVRLQWSREEELGWAPYGSAALVRLEAGLDAAGDVVSWRHEYWSNGYAGRPGMGLPGLRFLSASLLARPFERLVAVDPPAQAGGGSDRNAMPYYDFPARLVIGHRLLDMPLRTSALRSLGAHPNVFAIESFVDELAEAAQVDPVEFRLRHLGDERARTVLEAAAARAGWRGGDPAEGRGQGIAFARYKNTSGYCAVVADVEAIHQVRVLKLTVAADLGLVINPDGARNQLEGGTVQAASWTLKERVRFDRQRVTSTTWESYPILRFSEVPDIDITLVDGDDRPPLGAGEITIGPTAAAIANAVHHALGVRVRDLPLTPENIAAAL
jgi:nicotinate dehydrogenase subunit B